MAWIDQHCHIDPGRDGVAQVAAANAAGVTRMVSVGCDFEQSTQMAAIALEHDGVYATAGVHPHEASGGLDGIAELLDLPQVVAVGEAGLDYHYDHSPRVQQRDVFAAPDHERRKRHHQQFCTFLLGRNRIGRGKRHRR